jgi:hypothetical protein
MIIKEQCWGEDVEIEILRDGTLTFHGYDPQFDQAMGEFHGEGPSKCYHIMESWDATPCTVIDYWLCPDYDFRKLIAVDVIDRFCKSPVFDRIYPRDVSDNVVAEHQALIAKYIEVARRYSTTKSHEDKKALYLTANSIFNFTSEVSGYNNESYMAANARQSLGYFLDAIDLFFDYASGAKGVQRGIASEVVSCIATAVATSIDGRIGGSEYKRTIQTEVDWFVRRFVDAMEAHQAEEPWPPLEVTP